MAEITNLNNPTLPWIDNSNKTYWAANGTTADAQGNDELRAAPSTGSALYITFIHINCATDTTIVINDANAALLGPFTFKAAGSNNVQLRFDSPIKLTNAQALNVDAAGAGNVAVYVEGFTI